MAVSSIAPAWLRAVRPVELLPENVVDRLPALGRSRVPPP